MGCLYGLAASEVLNIWLGMMGGGVGEGGVYAACYLADALKTHYSKVQHGTDCYKDRPSRSDYLERPTQGKTAVEFRTWIFRSFC